jgi:hypothetical protein
LLDEIVRSLKHQQYQSQVNNNTKCIHGETDKQMSQPVVAASRFQQLHQINYLQQQDNYQHQVLVECVGVDVGVSHTPMHSCMSMAAGSVAQTGWMVLMLLLRERRCDGRVLDDSNIGIDEAELVSDIDGGVDTDDDEEEEEEELL